MRKIAVVYSGNSAHYRTFNEPKYRKFIAELIYLPDLLEASLENYDVLIVPSQLNERLLLGAKEKILAFAEQGGVVAAFGPQPWEWLPNQKWEERETNFWWWKEKGASSGLVLAAPQHDLFNYITLEDATWHQHGVFWPVNGAEKLITTEDGGAVLYVDKISTEGTWIVTTLDPDYHFGSYFMPATERFLDGFLPWLAQGKIS
ncbi:hypothetical protein ACUXCC_000026 [Cytobacillus horneckiae]|uniref:ThuA-like domain-containing protein n=1 Tax=Cytobacillus horneckiae TaxID=549687 RepID=A0A2N0ZJ35_9BACI|nr:hypothetical protein [Cytobacillus horneckiae]MBN6884895.1 hypothetical protein [Cytobacillus horneckiae]MCM3179360.1 hypothetical protein [Cytobacillus horneckiae]MEC1158962.1 hypothetical protein [Cytobacillus horneckiae]MED2937916.1 hypothetical protein [Cytobacillus horneckiae]PKG29517.1 hypothetical protein CWS20_08330 [Cytobacillus horneckiae]